VGAQVARNAGNARARGTQVGDAGNPSAINQRGTVGIEVLGGIHDWGDLVPHVNIDVSLPVLETRRGSLFSDRNDANITWFLPVFAFDTPFDASFNFAVSHIGLDEDGDTLFKASLKFSVAKQVPPDAEEFGGNGELREIPLALLSAELEVTYFDGATGASMSRRILGVAEPTQGGKTLLRFDAVVGSSVLHAFSNFKSSGSSVRIVSQFDAWRRSNSTVADLLRSSEYPPLRGRPPYALWRQRLLSRQRIRLVRWQDATRIVEHTPPGSPEFFRTVAANDYAIPIGNRFAASDYQLLFTIEPTSGGGAPHVIHNVDDLRGHATQSSEFIRLYSLGDDQIRYPSIAKLYLGRLSRTIVIIPTRYVLARRRSGCAAACSVVLDTASVGGRSAKVEFDFLLVPDFSPVDLALLRAKILSNDRLADCVLTYPSANAATQVGLLTGFDTNTECVPGGASGTYALLVELSDTPQAPAVANANIFIAQLARTDEPFVTGSIVIEVDDLLGEAISVPVVLTFCATQTDDQEIVGALDSEGRLQLINATRFALSLRRYCLAAGQAVSAVDVNFVLEAQEALVIAAPGGDSHGIQVLADAQIHYTGADTMAEFQKYVTVSVQDVQTVEYLFGVDAGPVKFSSRSLASLRIHIAFVELESVSAIDLDLNRQQVIEKVPIALPIMAAFGKLLADIRITLVFEDSARPQEVRTLRNDFLRNPVMLLPDNALN
jgi:hypothetical protein